MRVAILTKENTDYARDVTTYLDDFKRFTGHDLEVIDPESPEGVSFCTAYGLYEYPCIIATGSDGQMVQLWQGLPLPTINEVSYYAGQE